MWVSVVAYVYAGPLQSHRITGYKINKHFRMAGQTRDCESREQ